jgi:hypothetical protein
VIADRFGEDGEDVGDDPVVEAPSCDDGWRERASWCGWGGGRF